MLVPLTTSLVGRFTMTANMCVLLKYAAKNSKQFF
jgi:hypothetical protein